MWKKFVSNAVKTWCWEKANERIDRRKPISEAPSEKSFLPMRAMRKNPAFLLAVPLRLSDLHGLHEEGHRFLLLQQHHLDLSRMQSDERLWQPVESCGFFHSRGLDLISANRLPPRPPRPPRSHASRGNAYQDASRPSSAKARPILEPTPIRAFDKETDSLVKSSRIVFQARFLRET